MRTNTIDAAGLRTLRGLVGGHAKQLVWDINAVYVVRAAGTIKIEKKLGVVESPTTHVREDVFPLSVGTCREDISFKEEGEPGFGYWVVAVDEPITKIEIIRVAIRFPRGPQPWEAVPPSSVRADASDVELIDCGVFVHTPVGVLAAIPDAWFAVSFRHEFVGSGTSVSLVDPPEAVAMLPEEYELVPLPAES